MGCFQGLNSMPKGDNPNSRKNLEKGKATRFRKGDTQGKREAAMASNRAQAKAKTLSEELKSLLEVEITNSTGDKVKTSTATSTAMIKEALKGNVRAYEIIRDTIGQKPTEKVEQLVITPEVDFDKLANLRKALKDD